MRGVRCWCIDDKNKPSEIPNEKWIKKGEEYHITHIFIMVQQGRIQGVELAELDIADCIPYTCFRLSRFAIRKEDLEKLMQLAKDCNELNDITEIKEFVEKIGIKEEVL